MEDAVSHARRNADRFVRELASLISLPSVSSDRRRAPDVARCAAWLARALHAAGLEHVRERRPPGGGPPIVTADWLHAPGAPLLLIYGHYDVQPADGARDGWNHPPFEPALADDELGGRGASDDKGQLWAHIKAIECALATRGELPINVRVVLEGEEEVGSEGLLALLAREPGDFAADAAVISDMPIISPAIPAITYAMRGSAAAQVTVSRAGGDLHSGQFGGAIADPLFALCRIAASLRGPGGRIALDGFYDSVRPVGDDERRELARVAALARAPLGGAAGDAPEERDGERGFSAAERATIRPSLVVTGLSGGWQGEGHKMILGTGATMKVNLRLVPDQDPAAAVGALRAHVVARAPPGLAARVVSAPGTTPVLIDRAHPVMAAAARAYTRAFGRRPLFRRSGGSLPIAAAFQRLGVAPLMMGFALPDDHAHGPNEKLHLPTFFRGVETSLALMEELARLGTAAERSVPWELRA